MDSKERGFTLIELMIVVAVLTIISTIAFPSYQNYALRGKRAEAKTAVLGAAQALERYFTNNNAYTTNLAAAGYKNISGDTPATSYYTLQVTVPDSTSFIIRAVPNNFQDPACGIFTYNQAGQRGVENATDPVSKCW